MLRIGLTGGIGSGKTTACRIFTALGVPVYNSDNRAKTIMVSDRKVIEEIKSFLGEEAYAGGKPDTRYIAGKVFNDKSLLSRLNAAVHPAVMDDFHKWAEHMEDCGMKYVIQENAILFEAGFDEGMDYTITVSAPENERISRAAARDGSTPERIKERVNHQMTDGEREKLADFILHNGEKDLLIAQVAALHEKLSSLGRQAGPERENAYGRE